MLSGDEQRYLEAQMAFNAGKPIMSDGEPPHPGSHWPLRALRPML